ncbi:MAG: hypothetical protein LUO85_01555 [Methanomassiliicoccales archaeon]|nr:hypothetical protein [Methanomassiliicoccales archaeon]
MAGVDNDDRTFRCHACGKNAVPITFSSTEDWIHFRQSKIKGKEQERVRPDFSSVPILPVDTRPLLSVGGIDMPILKLAEVVDLRWDGSNMDRNDYHVSFDRYWRAISGHRYNASDILLMDLSGVRNGQPNFRVLRELVKHKYDVWLDLGIRSEADIYDAFAIEVSRALVDSSLCGSLKLFEEIFALSDRCVPCIQVANGEVIWKRSNAGPASLMGSIKAMKDIGYEEVAVIDVRRLGTKQGVNEAMLEELEGAEIRVIVGGGVVESDQDHIKAKGFQGAFIDPFTPIITDIVAEVGENKEFVSSPATVTKKTRSAIYRATD